MTTVLAVQTDSDVLLAWDSQLTRGNEYGNMLENKVWCNNGIIFGGSGTTRLLDLIYAMEVPDYDGSDARRWIIRTLVPEIQKAIEDSLQTVLREEDGSLKDSSLMVVVDCTVFLLDSNFSPTSTAEGLVALGSGGDYAKGAYKQGADPRSAVAIASALDPYTGGTIHFSSANELIILEDQPDS